MKVSDEFQTKYINYLIKELELKKNNYKDLKTIYIGGGTPSSLRINNLELLLVNLHKYIDFNNILEFTIEANPSDVTLDFINLLNKYHINRVSLGVQTLNKKKLLLLNRKHTKHEVINALKLLKNNGILNINCDLIYGCSFDNFRLIQNDLRILKKYATHFSCYSLILEEKTILYKLKEKGLFTELSSAKERKIYYKIINYLNKHHYNHYETSNFSLDNYQSIHNLTYWNYLNYEALGASASSKICNKRLTNIKNIEKYYEGLDNNNLIYDEAITLEEEDQIKEYIIMGLRKTSGIDLGDFNERFNKDFFDLYPFTSDLIKKGALLYNKNSLSVAKNMFFVSNEILVYYM